MNHRSSFARLAVATTALFLAAPALGGDVKEIVHLVVAGGPKAGTYDASSERGGCSAGLTGPGSWGNQLSNPKDKDPAKFNSVQLIVPDAKAAASGTDRFFLMVGFGPLSGRSAEYTVDTREKPGKGSGTVTVKDKGATAAVEFDVKTADGIGLKGTIECKSVVRGQ